MCYISTNRFRLYTHFFSFSEFQKYFARKFERIFYWANGVLFLNGHFVIKPSRNLSPVVFSMQINSYNFLGHFALGTCWDFFLHFSKKCTNASFLFVGTLLGNHFDIAQLRLLVLFSFMLKLFLKKTCLLRFQLFIVSFHFS